MGARQIDPPSVAASETFKSHWWWRPGWKPGRRMYSFFLTFEHSMESAEQIQSHYAPALITDALDIVPARWMHLTVQGLGFTDEVERLEVDAVTAAITEACRGVSAISISVSNPTVAEEGVVLKAAPSDPLAALKLLVRDILTDVRDPSLLEGSAAFTPHVTLAYANKSADAAGTIRSLAQLGPFSIEVNFNRMQLVRLGRDEQMYTWQVISEIGLGSVESRMTETFDSQSSPSPKQP